MIKVGLIGVPGSGKSDLAYGVASNEDVVIDGYVEDLASSLDMHITYQSTYIPNLMVVFQRETSERMATVNGRGKDAVRITCGTILDSLAYAAVKVENYANSPKTDLTRRQLFREMSAAQVISIMLEDLWEYDHLFYLPPPADLDSPHLQRVNETIQAGMQKWNIPAVDLSGKKISDRLTAFYETIHSKETSDPDSDRAREEEQEGVSSQPTD